MPATRAATRALSGLIPFFELDGAAMELHDALRDRVVTNPDATGHGVPGGRNARTLWSAVS